MVISKEKTKGSPPEEEPINPIESALSQNRFKEAYDFTISPKSEPATAYNAWLRWILGILHKSKVKEKVGDYQFMLSPNMLKPELTRLTVKRLPMVRKPGRAAEPIYKGALTFPGSDLDPDESLTVRYENSDPSQTKIVFLFSSQAPSAAAFTSTDRMPVTTLMKVYGRNGWNYLREDTFETRVDFLFLHLTSPEG